MATRSKDITAPLAGDIVSLLDFLSRVINAADAGNGHYAHEKASQLSSAALQLYRRLSRHPLPTDPNEPLAPDPAARFDPQRLRATVAADARHYLAGRALYPIGDDPRAAERRHALEAAANDLIFAADLPGLTPALADSVAAWLREKAHAQGESR
jgi:hypothetical protein